MNQLSLDAHKFLESTRQFVFQGINPGGYYMGIWSRDASYIIKDWFMSGRNLDEIMMQIHLIWSHQIEPGKEKLIYGRGSPETGFRPVTANKDSEIEFKGALPTTIYHHHNFCEVYGKCPDIDSTALMVSTTSSILSSLFRSHNLLTMSNYSRRELDLYTKKSEIFDQLVSRMISAIEYLAHRDRDKDFLLEQNYNEDWMDTTLRIGKIVYSQATWILALKNFSALLFELGRMGDVAEKTVKLAQKSIDAVQQKLWSQENFCYVDLQKENQRTSEHRILTQDVLLFLLAIAEDVYHDKNSKNGRYIKTSPNDDNDKSNNNNDNNNRHESKIYHRAVETLDTIRNRIWKGAWPLVTEVELIKTGPLILKPHQYHNYTFWPWMTALEMLARSKFNKLEQSDLLLLSTLISEDYRYVFYEWIDPNTGTGNGAFPFRTGVSCMRMALTEILKNHNILV